MSEPGRDTLAPPPVRPWSRSQVAAAAILGALLAAVVGMSSGSSPWPGQGGAGSTVPALVGDVLVVVLAAGLCLFAGLAWIGTPRRRTVKKRRGEGLVLDELAASLRTGSLVLLSGLAAVVGLIVAFALLLGRVSTAGQTDQGAGGAPGGGTGAPSAPAGGGASAVSPTFHWFVIALVASFAVVVPLGLLVRRRRRAAERDADVAVPEEPLVRAVRESIDEIEHDPDARRSIIRAYARMEQAFDDAGAPRRPHEAPFEFVGRALRAVRVSPSAAERLATLFERARFSGHAADADAKAGALAALREIQRQLEPPA